MIMPAAAQTIETRPFAYRAQDAAGEWATGTVDAADADAARARLSAMGLRVYELDPVEAAGVKPRRLSADDFAAFNQQLAQLTRAGMPVESGLRLIASDMRSRRMSRAVEAVAADLESGVPLPDAFAKHAVHFPALYGRVVEAGIRTGNLPGVLLNLGRHLDLMQRLRRNLWRAASYPIMAAVALAAVMLFIGYVVAVPIESIYDDIGMDLPWPTVAVFWIGRNMPLIATVIVAHIVGLMVVWRVSQMKGYEQRFVDRFLAWVPLIGRVIRSNLASRWCGAVGLAVDAGLDLPAGIELAGKATGSHILEDDGKRIVAAHESGEPLQTAAPVHLVPRAALTAMELGVKRNDLPRVMQTLTQLYSQQSEQHLVTVNAVLSPLLIAFIAMILAVVVAALYLPLHKMLSGGIW